MNASSFKVKAVYDYSSPHDDDLNFSVGQVITVTEEEDAEWYVGEYTSDDGVKHGGLFPRNFVERFEPQAPKRPARSRPKAEAQPEHQAAPVAAKAADPEAPALELAPREEPETAPLVKEEPPAAPKPQPAKPTPTAAPAKPPPPEMADKPSSSSFKDRIAAFNKPAAPPIAPKPSSGPANQSFIKKPFVAPPPAHNTYVPAIPKQDAPHKVYRREEDPEIAERMAQDQKDAREAGLASAGADDVDEEAPKATSLKERIALLQRQQKEQAARRAEGGGGGGGGGGGAKPKRPTKPRTESDDAGRTESGAIRSDVRSPELTARESSDAFRPLPGRMPSYDVERDDLTKDPISDGNEADQSGAGETTEDAGGDSMEVEEIEQSRPRAPVLPPRTFTGGSRDEAARSDGEEAEQGHDAEGEEQGEEEEEEEMDPETRRKEELRARMAKMSGGMGMPGMFGMPPPKASTPARKASGKRSPSTEARSPPPQQRVPMVSMPGVPPRTESSPTSEERTPHVEKEYEPGLPITESQPAEAVPDVEELAPQSHEQTRPQAARAPTAPQDRPVPLPPSRDTAPSLPANRPVPEPRGRPVPPPPPRAAAAEESDEDEDEDVEPPFSATRPVPQPPPPIPGLQTKLPHRGGPGSSSTADKRSAQTPTASAAATPAVPSSDERRSSRAPPAPIGSPQMPPPPAQERPPPPPPPPPTAIPPRRQSTGRKSSDAPSATAEEKDLEYEGDYDTDIAPTATHKDALKARATREGSLDGDSTLFESNTGRSPAIAPPPIPNTQQRTAPPPPPQQAPPSRRSTEATRAPPPVPPPRPAADDDDEYDPYRYQENAAVPSRSNTGASDRTPASASLYNMSPQSNQHRGIPPLPTPGPPPPSHHAPPPLPPEPREPPVAPVEDPTSVEESRRSMNPTRRSMTSRRSMEPGSRPLGDDGGHIARDIDLAESSMWWVYPNALPPALQGRLDIAIESDESTTSKRGGRSTTSKDVYVLFQDYSQTVITVQYDTKDPSHDVHLEQRHEASPPRLRQDQLEAVHARYGEPIATAAANKQGQAVGDGTPQALLVDLLQSAGPSVLQPVGSRAYGALVYSNMANSSVSQYDEIRAGDIVSFRNAKFKGKHGAMHAKYSMDVGKPDHVAVVMEWDGTKKKIRALEQGREKEGKKAKLESFRVGDLGGGEVKVWRVVGRDYVGWESNA